MSVPTNKKNAQELHTEISEWISYVKLVRDELKMYRFQLAEIISRNNNGEALMQGQYFQNQFIRQAEVIEGLYHELNAADQVLTRKVNGNASADQVLMVDHVALRNKVEAWNRLYNDEKIKYRSFRLQWF